MFLHAGLVRFGLASGIQGRWGGGTFIIAAEKKLLESIKPVSCAANYNCVAVCVIGFEIKALN